jgi:2-keto-4-pentenoate hydratase
MRYLVLSLLLLSLPAVAQADCKDYYDRVKTIAEFYVDQDVPLAGLKDIPDYATARCIADKVVELGETQGDWGAPVGYKVGLTSKAIQEQLGIGRPAWGRLTANMLRPAGEPVPADVTTPEEAARHVSQVTPFIELADLVFAEGEPLSIDRIVAINVGATLGIVGTSSPMTPELAAALPEMVVAVSIDGATQWRVPATALMGHPLQPLVWLAQTLKAEGRSLKAGDVVSLGSFARPVTPDANGVIQMTVNYLNADGADLLPQIDAKVVPAQP